MVSIRTGSKICFVKQCLDLSVDYGNGKNRKGIWLDTLNLDDNIRAAPIGFQTFTGKSYHPVLETGHCRHTFILVKDKKFKKHLSTILGVIWRCNHPDSQEYLKTSSWFQIIMKNI